MTPLTYTLSCLVSALLAFLPVKPALADVQAQINAACSTGGTIQLPATLTLTTTLNFICAPGSIPLTLQGAPTTITCPATGVPCIAVGSTDVVSETGSRLNLTMRDLYLSGPGRTVSNSEGVRILPTADDAVIDHIKIDGFDVGMHLVGGQILLVGVRVSNATISPIWNTSVNVAVHLDGPVGDVYFDNFAFNAWQRAILADGAANTGASSSFVNGFFNTTKTPGTAAVYVTSTSAAVSDMLIADVQDWETACPFIEVANHGRVMVNGVAFSGDPQSSGTNPTIKLSGSSSVSWLRMSNVNMGYCSGHGDFIEIDSPSTFTTITGSDLQGSVHFFAAGQAAFAGNRFATGNCLTGTRGTSQTCAHQETSPVPTASNDGC